MPIKMASSHRVETQCSACGKVGTRQVGETCGEREPARFVTKTPMQIVAGWERMRRGLPSKDIAERRCLGVMLPLEAA